ncbi:TonB-dependent receptor domain-containing protein [Parerythrobacter jejuensis]|uniref:TonB-dependent receptor n=1 Tax=Parerythrobacter jejuensis TaxID=795812 RepID=A0A845AQA2_9SPHN|nr:TonB-dependent receptor [Parerythrobacter jejuensis]MXP31577.1 TonB-dependent receptor [Parerythrobacter jejuensis]
MSTRFNKAALLTGTFMAGALIATPAFAQDADTDDAASSDDGLIVVTGSRIAQRNVETAAPIAVVGDEEFKLSGTVNVENVVNTLPQVVPGFTSNSNNPGTGTATLNLRGLGSARTMVLVNGRRWMFYDTAQIVDLNTIPSFLLDSVDVVTGGASAVYGSDALAGVVNFRLKDVEGIEVGGQYSITQEGDGERYNLYGAIGTSFDDGRGSATVYAEYFNRQPIFQGDRAFSNFALGGETFGANLLQFGSSTLPNGVIRYFGDGDRTGTDFAANNAVVFDDVAGDFRQRAGDTYNYAPVNYLQIPQERYLMGGYADYEFSDGHEAYLEVSFVNNRVAQELAATPVTGTFNVNLATIQPFLNAADFAQLQQLNATETDGDPNNIALFLQRRTIETGPRNSLDERNAFRVLGGVRGAITDWLNYDAYYMYARTRNANVQDGNISRSAFQAGVDGTGTTINPFGLGTLTPAMVNAISIQAQNGDISTLEVANAALSGFVGDLGWGGGDIGFAVGVEYREVGSRFIPDTALSSGDVIGFNAGQATEGSYNVREIFAELNVPIFETDGGTRLEVNGAARYSDYSIGNIGGVWTYAGGVEFSPIPDVTLRGQYQRAVRAPNVGELFGGQAIGFPGATDPCSTAAATPGSALGNLCVANGVPAGSLGNPGIQLNAQIPANFGGNPNLQEETSDSFTAGIVLQPSFIPGLTITADYFDIEVENAISTISLQQSFDLCFNQSQDATSVECSPFFAQPIRNAAGIITVNNPVPLGAQNIATLGVSGVDLQVNYSTTIPFSLLTDTGEQTVNLNFLGTWSESSSFQGFPGANVVECAGFFGQTCGEPTPSFKWTSRLSFVDGPLTTSIRWRHLSSVEDDDAGTDFTAFNGIEDTGAYDLIDLTFSVDVNEQVTLAFGVNNLFDTLPGTPTFDAAGNVTNRPNGLLLGDNQEQANTYPSTYDVLGRDFFVSANFKF